MHNWGLLMVVDCGRPTRLELGSCRNTRIAQPALLGHVVGVSKDFRDQLKPEGSFSLQVPCR